MDKPRIVHIGELNPAEREQLALLMSQVQEKTPEKIANILAKKDATPEQLLVAKIDTRIVGFVGADTGELIPTDISGIPPGAIHIQWVGVGEEYQGIGIGTSLLHEIIRRLDKTIWLDCLESKRGWYQKLGFHEVGEKFDETKRKQRYYFVK